MKSLWISDKHNLARFDSIQPHFHLLSRREVEPELAAVCLDQGIGVIPYSPLAGGFLTGKYTREGGAPAGSRGQSGEGIRKLMNEQGFAVVDVLREIGQAHGGKTVAQVALAWQLALPFITAPIVGASTVAQLKESLGAVDFRLTEEEMKRLDDLTGVKRVYFDEDE
jgi:aryl-alcohol dehydrogenase-like predicted oxidoreductase